MAIRLDEGQRVFTLHTRHTTYQMKADGQDTLLHTYYGERTDDFDKSYFCDRADRGFSGNPYSLGKTDRTYSFDSLPLEYSCFGAGDYRITALRARTADGAQAAELRYKGYCITKGKYRIPGLPAVYAGDEEAETLAIRLADPYSGLEAELYYGILEGLDVITRTVRLHNRGTGPVTLEKAASLSLDWEWGSFDWMTFYGRHGMEQNVQRAGIRHGVQSVGSVRGMSSHQYNPFVMVCGAHTDEEQGSCYGFSFVYSGEFLIEAERDQMDRTRLLCGIHPDNFSWMLEAGEDLWLPEVIMAHSMHGLGGVSRLMHRTIREHICRGEWKQKRRPALINNWEATYFSFDAEKLVSIAREAGKLGLELFVMDDGWFGKRDDDNSGLGDWFPNEEKLGCTLKELAGRILAEGLQFGIWLEPESLSEDSDLHRAHPEWAVRIPGRKPCLSRNQLLLDLSNRDVQDYLLERLTSLLRENPITYVKWDLNRSLCDKYGGRIPPERQGEFAHRYVLGLYRILEELTARFPGVLFEGCCGGGGRFDAGILYYMPQIWGSDNTDAVERLSIQYGYSFGYPLSAVGAHISAVPNHQTGRITPLCARGIAAMAGAFGCELDVEALSEEERQEIQNQTAAYRLYYRLMQNGDYYRLTDPHTGTFTAWEIASPSGEEALLSIVYHHVQANPAPAGVRLHGLRAEVLYRVGLSREFHKTALEQMESRKANTAGAMCQNSPDEPLFKAWSGGMTFSGAALMQCGLLLPGPNEEYGGWVIEIRAAADWAQT